MTGCLYDMTSGSLEDALQAYRLLPGSMWAMAGCKSKQGREVTRYVRSTCWVFKCTGLTPVSYPLY